MSTPHIEAASGDFAPAVIMPGDPLRAQAIAQLILDNPRQVNAVRGNLGFTGTYQGRPLSVMASGMGQPSLTIYATELLRDYGVRRIIRVGTCGAIAPGVEIGDVVVALGAHTDSQMNRSRFPEISYAPVASWDLLRAAMIRAEEIREESGIPVHVGTVFSEDHFYFSPPGINERLAKYGCLALEMETAALYAVADEFQAQALTVLTVSDLVLTQGKDMTPQERENNFQNALSIALAAALS